MTLQNKFFMSNPSMEIFISRNIWKVFNGLNQMHEQNNETIKGVKGGTHLLNGTDTRFRTLRDLPFRNVQVLLRFLKKYRFPSDR